MNKEKIRLNEIIKQNKYFFYPYIIILLVSLTFVLINGHRDSFLIVNSFSSNLADIFFYYFTNVGDGLFSLLILIILLFINIRWSFYLLSGYLVSGILVQIIKRLTNLPRPKGLLGDIYSLHYVNGVDIHSYNSFPSGHSASGFALFVFLAFIVKSSLLKFIFLFFAFLVAYSRVYLAQHFPIDVLVGAIFGVTTMTWIYISFENKFNNNSYWFDKPIHKLFQK